MAAWQAGSARIGLIVSCGFVVVALALHLTGRALLRLVSPLAHARSVALRHSVIRLSRPGNQTGAILLVVGLGSFFMVAVRSRSQHDLLREFAMRSDRNGPDMFLIDIQRDQASGVTSTVAIGPGAARAGTGADSRPSGEGHRRSGRRLSLDRYGGRAAAGAGLAANIGDHLSRSRSGQRADRRTERSGPGARSAPRSPRSTGGVNRGERAGTASASRVGDTIRFDVAGRPADGDGSASVQGGQLAGRRGGAASCSSSARGLRPGASDVHRPRARQPIPPAGRACSGTWPRGFRTCR